ncbi:MAG: hypothetical protein AAGE03_07175 [Pseudomonadota bacterium]
MNVAAEDVAGRRQLQLDYLSEVIRFRIAQETSLSDTQEMQDQAEDDGPASQITYLADANVFFFYFRAAREHSAANPLNRVIREVTEDARADRDRDMPRLHRVSPAVITAQFIFSGNLPGQCGFPLYYNQEHGTEFQGRVSKVMENIIAQKVSLSEEKQADLQTETRAIVRELQRHIRSDNQEASIKGIRHVLDGKLPDLIRRYNLEHVDEALHLLHLVEGDVARPLRLAPGIDRTLLDQDPPDEMIADWRMRLESYHPEELYQSADLKRSSRDDAPRNQNIDVDAKVLARLQLLNQQMRDEQLDNRFVLITTSNAMISANSYWLQEREFDLRQSLVRSIHQFVPMANYYDIENFSQDAQPSQRLRTAMDGLFTFFFPSIHIGDWPRVLQVVDLYIRNLNRLKNGIDQSTERQRAALTATYSERLGRIFARAKTDGIDGQFRSIAEEWIRLINNSVGVSAQSLVEYYRAHLEEIGNSLVAVNHATGLRRSLSASYAEEQKTIAQRIALGNLRLSTNLMLGNTPSVMRRLVEVARAARPHLYLSAEDNDALQAILQLARTEGPQSVEPRLMAFIDNDKSGVVAERTLAVATVALQMGFWANAASFARTAFSLIRDRAAVAEDNSPESVYLKRLEAEALWTIGAGRRVALFAPDTSTDALTDMRPAMSRGRALMRQKMALERAEQTTDFVATARSQAEIAMLHVIALLSDRQDGEALRDSDFEDADRFGQKALFGANTILNDEDQDAPDHEATLRARLLAGMAMVMLRLLAHVEGRALRPDWDDAAPKLGDAVEADIDSLIAENYDSWPLLLRLFRLALGLSSDDRTKLRTLKRQIDDQVRLGGSVATPLERGLAEAALRAI